MLLAFVQGPSAQGPASASQKVLIKASKPYAALVQQIEARGGTVSHQYKYWDGIAAEISITALGAITAVAGGDAVTKDEIVPLPTVTDARLDRLAVPARSRSPSRASRRSPRSRRRPTSSTTASRRRRRSSAWASPAAAIVVAVIDSGPAPGIPGHRHGHRRL